MPVTDLIKQILKKLCTLALSGQPDSGAHIVAAMQQKKFRLNFCARKDIFGVKTQLKISLAFLAGSTHPLQS